MFRLFPNFRTGLEALPWQPSRASQALCPRDSAGQRAPVSLRICRLRASRSSAARLGGEKRTNTCLF